MKDEQPKVCLCAYTYWSNVRTRAAYWRSRSGRIGPIRQRDVHIMAGWELLDDCY